MAANTQTGPFHCHVDCHRTGGHGEGVLWFHVHSCDALCAHVGIANYHMGEGNRQHAYCDTYTFFIPMQLLDAMNAMDVGLEEEAAAKQALIEQVTNKQVPHGWWFCTTPGAVT